MLLHYVRLKRTAFIIQRLEFAPTKGELRSTSKIAERQRPITVTLRREAKTGSLPLHADEAVPGEDIVRRQRILRRQYIETMLSKLKS